MPVVVLPDIPLPQALVRSIVYAVGPVLFRHPTGSPWIVGATGGRRVVRATNGLGLRLRRPAVVACSKISGKASLVDVSALGGNVPCVRLNTPYGADGAS